MAITFVGASSATGSGVHASVPAHQAGDLILALAFNSASAVAPTVGTNFTQVGSARTSATLGIGCSAAILVTSGPGTLNTGWSNFDHQLLAVYRPALKVYNPSQGPELQSVAPGVTSSISFSSSGVGNVRPSACRYVALGVFVPSSGGSLATGVTWQARQPVTGSYDLVGLPSSDIADNYSVRLTTGGAGAAYQHRVYDRADTGVTAFQFQNSASNPDVKGSYFFFEIPDPQVRATAESRSYGLSGGDASFSLRSIADTGVFTLGATSPNVSRSTPLATGDFALTGLDTGLFRQYRLLVTSGAFLATPAADTPLVVRKDNYTNLGGVPPREPERDYGGSEPSYPSFLRPYYVKYNSVGKSRDLGTTDILIADLSGEIGTQAGTNTLFFKLTLPRRVELRVRRRATGASTDRFVSVGVLDGERKPVPLDLEGYATTSDIHNTPINESLLGMPAGTYYITVSSSQWQRIPYAITIAVGRYALLGGAAGGTFALSGRIPLIKMIGPALGRGLSTGTLVSPNAIKEAVGHAGGLGSPSLTLSIMRGVALGTMVPSGRLKATWKLSGIASGSDQSQGTLSSEAPYGGGYGY